MKRNSKFKTQNSKLPAHARLVRWTFTRFYREFAWTYDTVAAAVSGGQWPSWALAALPLLRGRVLELGCGTGNLQRALAAHPEYAAVGIDLSHQMLKLAQRKIPAAHLARAQAEYLPFPDVNFDTLVATFPSEYIVAPATLDEVQRVLRPGGQIVIVLGATYRTGTHYRRLIDLLYRVTLQRPVLSPTPASPTPQSVVAVRLAARDFAVREELHPDRAGGADVHVIIATQTAR